MTKKLSLKRSGVSLKQKMFPETIIHEILESNSEIEHYWKSLISAVQEIFASINKIFILGGRLGTKLTLDNFLIFGNFLRR